MSRSPHGERGLKCNSKGQPFDIAVSLPTRGEWIKTTENCGIKPFEKCSGTFRNRFAGIINSFDTNITNGFTEGCNNKIKVLKRNS